MPFFSLSLQKPGRVGEPKTTFNRGERSPTSGEAIELRFEPSAYSSVLAFWSDLDRLIQRVRELNEPRPQRAVPLPGVGEPWSDGTFWSDGTGWTE